MEEYVQTTEEKNHDQLDPLSQWQLEFSDHMYRHTEHNNIQGTVEELGAEKEGRKINASCR